MALNFDTLNAVLEGHNDKLLDLEMLAIKTGFWSAYYTHAKHPMSLDRIIEQIQDAYNGKESKSRKHVDTVDVDAFLQREAEFKARLLKMESK